MTNRRDAYDLDNKEESSRKENNTRKKSSDAWVDDYELKIRRPKSYGEY